MTSPAETGATAPARTRVNVRSPYTPGPGKFPPHLAGREGVTSRWEEALDDVDSGAANRAGLMLVTGARGVGKTAVLMELERRAERRGFVPIRLDASHTPYAMLSSLRGQLQEKSDSLAGGWQRALSKLDRIASVSFGGWGFSGAIATRSAPPSSVEGSRSLALALTELARECRRAFGGGGLVLQVDELQGAAAEDTELLAWMLHSLNVLDDTPPIVVAAAGLLSTHARMSESVSFGQRLFYRADLPPLLPEKDARAAILVPAADVGMIWEEPALLEVLDRSGCHPAYLQLYADTLARAALRRGSLVVKADAEVLGDIDREIEADFVGPRFSQLTDDEIAVLVFLARRGGTAHENDLRSTLRLDPRNLSRVLTDLTENGDIFPVRQEIVRSAAPQLSAYLQRWTVTQEIREGPTRPAIEM